MENIYFIQEGVDGPIKIGKTSSPTPYGRLIELQVGNYRRLHCRLFLTNGRYTEKELHQRFKNYYLAGEWFRPDKEIINFIEENYTPLPESKTNCWSIAELDFIKNNLETMTTSEMMIHLNRGRSAINQKRSELKMGKEGAIRIRMNGKRFVVLVHTADLGAVSLGYYDTKDDAIEIQKKYEKNPLAFQDCFRMKREYMESLK